jgi:hypothetical protein
MLSLFMLRKKTRRSVEKNVVGKFSAEVQRNWVVKADKPIGLSAKVLGADCSAIPIVRRPAQRRVR